MAVSSRPYGPIARWYDLVSGEPVYRRGREAAVELLRLQPGDVVLDVGCGTGLNLPLLEAAVGPSGRVIGLDASAAMLAQAGTRVRRAGWRNVRLVCADATTIEPEALRRLAGSPPGAVLATYALSLMPNWAAAWRTLVEVAGPGARVAVVDMAVPDAAAPWRALARAACRLGGADIDAHPWTAVEEEAADVRAAHAAAGHIQVRVGRLIR